MSITAQMFLFIYVINNANNIRYLYLHKCDTNYKYSLKIKYRSVAIINCDLCNSYSRKMKCVIFTILIMIATALAAPQGDKEATCSPIGGRCQQYNDCCRYLECLVYAASCVAKSGVIVPGQDNRPLGPGPYPPNVPLA
ncbi:uncharacterized protein LOC126856454 [Cataglyphis hispanica]|uniref:uncharacterized protein LOC126856454 n=1 Tax=Cataglyphis hispanica TaxID=1086592 RepID=UPI00217FCDB7|nr:uncharacterized protein LOC126856454 [Cataglyphis hispanica]